MTNTNLQETKFLRFIGQKFSPDVNRNDCIESIANSAASKVGP